MPATDTAGNDSTSTEKPAPEDASGSDSVHVGGSATTKGDEAMSEDDAKADHEEAEAHGPWNSDVDPRAKFIYTAPLFCPVSMRSHGILMDYRIFTCPLCHQSLTSKSRRDSSSVSGTVSSSEESDDEPDIKLVVNTVDMRDTHDDCIQRTPWPATFDLQEARKNVVHNNLAFEVVTVLETSVLGTRGNPPNSYRNQTRSATDILDNATIDIEVRQTTITVHSRDLVRMMKSVVTYYPGVNLNGNTVRLAEPFALITHHYSQLETFLAKAEDSTALQEGKAQKREKNMVHRQLESLLEFVKQPKYHSPVEEEIARNAKGLCTFRMLWYLFRPGSTVYLSRDGRLSAKVISHVNVDERILRPEAKWISPYEITLWYLDFDGRHVGRSEETVSIPAFEGERLVTSLRLFPVEYRDNADGGETKRELEELGRRWFDYLLGAQAHYNGELIGPLSRQVSVLQHRQRLGVPTFFAST